MNNKVVNDDLTKKEYTFDSIIPPIATQESVFEITTEPVIDHVLEGYNGTVFAYGQTGTGKTFTIVGNTQASDSFGIIPRSLQYIFKKIGKDYEIAMSFIQIYKEGIQDLLEPGNVDVKIREAESGVYMTGISWIPIGSLEQGMNIFGVGEKNRAVAFSSLGAHSSRSHAVLMIRVEHKNENLSNTSSILYLIDLAGSERVKKTKATANRLDEAKKINFSLSALGNCIHALTDPNTKHIPYRDSKLTRLLQDSLGGSAKTSIIVTIGPSINHLEETVSSLNFGKRAMCVQNKPRINRSVDYKALCAKLQKILEMKDELLREAEAKIKKLSVIRKEKMINVLQEKSINNENEVPKFNKQEEEIQRLRGELKRVLELVKNNKEVKESMINYKAQIADAMEMMHVKEEEMNKYKAEIKAVTGQNINLREYITKLKSDDEQIMQLKDKEINELEIKVTSLNELLTETEQLKAKNSKVIETLQNTITHKNELISNLIAKYSDIKKEHLLVIECKDQMNKVKDNLRDYIEEIREKLELNTKKLKEKGNVIKSLKQQIINTEHNTEAIEDQKRILKSEVQSLQQQFKNIKEQSTEDLKKSNIVREQYNRLLEENTKLKADHEQLKEILRDKEAEVNTLKAQTLIHLQNARARIAELQNEIKLRDTLITESTCKHQEHINKLLSINSLSNKRKGEILSKIEELSVRINKEKELMQKLSKDIKQKYEEAIKEITSLQHNINLLNETKQEYTSKLEEELIVIKKKLRTLIELHANTTTALTKQYKQIKHLKEREEVNMESIASYCTDLIVERVSSLDLYETLKKLRLEVWIKYIVQELIKLGQYDLSLLFSSYIKRDTLQCSITKSKNESSSEIIKETIDHIICIVELESEFGKQKINPKDYSMMEECDESKEVNELMTISDKFLLNNTMTEVIRPLYNLIIRNTKQIQNLSKKLKEKELLITTLTSLSIRKDNNIIQLKNKVKEVEYGGRVLNSAIVIQQAWRKWLSIKNDIETAKNIEVFLNIM